MAHDYRKVRYVKWVMKMWLGKLEKKLKKRHMEQNLVPLVHMHRLVKPAFNEWFNLY